MRQRSVCVVCVFYSGILTVAKKIHKLLHGSLSASAVNYLLAVYMIVIISLFCSLLHVFACVCM